MILHLFIDVNTFTLKRKKKYQIACIRLVISPKKWDYIIKKGIIFLGGIDDDVD